MTVPIRLTQYSHGAGCGCKIAPAVLEQIVASKLSLPDDPNLLVGHASKDDAAVYDIGGGQSVISTTDFFMPIVDDPFTFGRIAATNAISDIYAMGGKPLMAIAILGWPLDKLGAEVAQQVVDGGRQACADAGISLAGGHSIDAPEPIFGAAVTGLVQTSNLKRNDAAEAGCKLYLSKPLGIGVLTTAEKKGRLRDEHKGLAADWMCRLNSIGSELAALDGVRAMTDVTGFGLLGHLLEMCQGSGMSASVDVDRIALLPGVAEYIAADCVPGGTLRNFDSYGDHVGAMREDQKAVLCDPQTSGGLLIAVEPAREAEFHECCARHGLELSAIGELTAKGGGPTIRLR